METEQRNPRLVRKGDVIVVDGREEVVRRVQVVLDLADGTTHTFQVSEPVDVVLDSDPVNEEVQAVVEEEGSEAVGP